MFRQAPTQPIFAPEALMPLQLRHPRSPKEAGFTALELIVVIAIFGTLMTVGTTLYTKQLRSDRVRAASNELAGWLEAVRRAAERGIACDVTIPDNSAATSSRHPNPTDVATAAPAAATIPENCLQNSPFRIESGRAFDQYAITSTSNTFSFTPRGSVFLAGGEDMIEVRIQALEGGIQVTEGGDAADPSYCVRVEPPLGLIETGPCQSAQSQP